MKEGRKRKGKGRKDSEEKRIIGRQKEEEKGTKDGRGIKKKRK